MKKEKRDKLELGEIISVNLLLVGLVVFSLVMYSTSYHNKIRNQNLDEAANTARSSASIASVFLERAKTAFSNKTAYISSASLDEPASLDYLAKSNTDKTVHYEILNSKGVGQVAVGGSATFSKVSYSASAYGDLYKICSASDGVLRAEFSCTPEFTNAYDGIKSFAFYNYIAFSSTPYTLLAVYQSSAFQNLIEPHGDYLDSATVLMAQNGDYVLGSPSFKGTNLFNHFYIYSNLTLDEKNAIIASFAASKDDPLYYYYKNANGDDSVYLITKVADTSWYCVYMVPLSSFHNSESDMLTIIQITILLLALLVFNGLWMMISNRRLKISAEKEIEAGKAKTDFLSRMSHDIRTPLNVILGTDLLAKRENNPPATDRYLNDIEKSGKFLLSLVNDVLDLNKVESGKMELHYSPCPLKEIASSMRAIILPLCQEKGIAFTLTGFDREEVFLLDEVRVNQILFNILSNSVKFTPKEGAISLCLDLETGENGQTILHFHEEDTGIGMSEAFQQKMFDPFSQEEKNASSNLQGTGLGLAIVHNFVGLMKGHIDVHSVENKGTFFDIFIPAAPSEKTEQAAAEKEISLQILASKRVLLVEDNAINSEIARILLQDQSMIVETAANGQEALNKVYASKEGYYDLILMDMRMPVMNGLDATKAIRSLPREDAKSIPIIAMTANAYDIDVQSCLEAGMNAHIAKPIDPQDMNQKIANELTKKATKK